MGSRVASPGYSTDLESPAQGLSGKIVRSHNGQLEAPFWGDCPFLGGLGNSLGDLVKALRDERHMGSLAASRWCTVAVHWS